MQRGKKREQNWSTREKDCLREFINCHIHVIEDKSNDLRMIAKKRSAWAAIQRDMEASGFERNILRMKQQWVRMKIGARKAVSKVREARSTTGNVVVIPELDESDLHIQSMIAHDLEEDTILVDSDTLRPVDSSSGPNIENPLSLQSNSPNATIDLEIVPICSSTLVGSNAETSIELDTVPTCSSTLVTRLQNLPKRNASKVDVIKERQEQIANETTNTNDLHLLKVQLLKAQIAHEARMQKRAEEQAEELHSLKKLLLMKQIEKE